SRSSFRDAPRRSTLVDSMITSPAPPAANFPAFIRCQSVGKPLIAEYWCIGATTMRFLSSTSLRLIGENGNGVVTSSSPNAADGCILAARGKVRQLRGADICSARYQGAGFRSG